ncbi:MAG: hypothetical protein AD742_06820 [Methylibium sp. NZG]|nr:MAG: hypothetical protein AD742_06820 [Methylibium sp. NZG]
MFESLFRRSERTPSELQPNILPKRSVPKLGELNSFFYPVFWAVNRPETFAKKVETLTQDTSHAFYASDNLITWGRNNSLLDDLPFVEAWKANIESESDRAIAWRRYVLACAAYHCVQLDGDFVECGAYTGVGVKTVVDYLGGQAFPKTFWAYDIFEHDDSMLNHPMPEHGPGLFDRVRAKFAEYPQVRLVKGLIPQCFEGNMPERIAYLHIDLNQAPAEVAALDALFDRMVPGGILVLDDYEWGGTYRPQKLAEDAWFDERRYRVMPLPTGQGLVIKR